MNIIGYIYLLYLINFIRYVYLIFIINRINFIIIVNDQIKMNNDFILLNERYTRHHSEST